jgi:iron complex transport system ATP-binding protein
MISVRSLSLELGGYPILHDVSLQCVPGKVTVLLGPNGAGKSSLMRALAGLHPSASVFLDDQSLASISPKQQARRIGYLPQEAALAWNISVRELVGLGRLPFASAFAAPSAQDREQIETALIATDTLHFADRRIETLSGGERARVKLARLLAGDPDWFLADEPLANLDPAHQRDMLRLLRAVAAKGKGVVLILHQLDAALNIADEVVLLKNGAVMESGLASKILTPDNLEKLFDTGFQISQSGGRAALTQSW